MNVNPFALRFVVACCLSLPSLAVTSGTEGGQKNDDSSKYMSTATDTDTAHTKTTKMKSNLGHLMDPEGTESSPKSPIHGVTSTQDSPEINVVSHRSFDDISAVSRNLTDVGADYFRKIGDFIPDADVDPVFGSSIAINDEGDIVAIWGSFADESYVDVFKFDSGADSWSQLGPRIYTDVDEVAPSVDVALSGDGSTLAIGAVYLESSYSTSGVKVYKLANNIWNEVGSDIAAGRLGALPGLKVSLSGNGDKLAIGARNFEHDGDSTPVDIGRAMVFSFSGTDWEQIGTITGESAKDNMGASISVTTNGDYVAIGETGDDAPNGVSNSGSVRIFSLEDPKAFGDDPYSVQVGSAIEGEAQDDNSGFSVKLVKIVDSSLLKVAIGAIYNDGVDGEKKNAGHVRVFAFDLFNPNNGWNKVGSDMDGDFGATLDYTDGQFHVGDSFGFSLGMSLDGDRVAVGAPFYSKNRFCEYYYGNVKLFEFSNTDGDWVQIAGNIVGESDNGTTGWSVGLSGNGKTLVIGGPSDPKGKVEVWYQDEKSNAPSMSPSTTPSALPTANPSSAPTSSPSTYPTAQPSSVPTLLPSTYPTAQPSSMPSPKPSALPSTYPTAIPSSVPTSLPSTYPTAQPSSVPSSSPTRIPTARPSIYPTALPSFKPSTSPSKLPTVSPSSLPTTSPSTLPTAFPSSQPSSQPSVSPTLIPIDNLPHLTFRIKSNFEPFGKLSGSDITWCLQADKRVPGQPLFVRPCETNDSDLSKKQLWFYEGSRIKLRKSESLCIKDEAKRLTMQQCSTDGNDFFIDRATGTIFVKRPSGKDFYFGVDNLKLFSRVRLFRRELVNESWNKWEIMFEEPSTAPSLSSSPSVEPSSSPSQCSSQWVQAGSVLESEAPDNRFGSRVSISADGMRMAVGGILNDGNGENSGHVRVFDFDVATEEWLQVGDDINGEAPHDQSGISVSLSNDGKRLAVAARYNDNDNGNNAGHVRVYKEVDGAWIQLGDDIDGEAAHDTVEIVALSGDGNHLAVSSPLNDANGEQSGKVRVYSYIGGQWTQIGSGITGLAAGDQFGWASLAISFDGKVVAAGSHHNESEYVRVLTFINNEWSTLGNIMEGAIPDENFGRNVALSLNGKRIVIGAPWNDEGLENRGRVIVMDYDDASDTWVQAGDAIYGEGGNNRFGVSVSISGDGDRIGVGALFNDNENGKWAGHARVFDYNAGTDKWIQIGEDIDGESPGDTSGMSVSLSKNGMRLAVGAPRFQDTEEMKKIKGGSARVYEISSCPSTIPTKKPTEAPSASPTVSPTKKPTDAPIVSSPNTVVLPATTTSGTVHGICIANGSFAEASSTQSTLTYSAIDPFTGTQKAWGNRAYTIYGQENTPCADGIFLQPSLHNEINQGTVITVTASPGSTICVFVEDGRGGHNRNGGWPNSLPSKGFTNYGLQPNFGWDDFEWTLFCKTPTL